jgi:hypothetical protein
VADPFRVSRCHAATENDQVWIERIRKINYGRRYGRARASDYRSSYWIAGTRGRVDGCARESLVCVEH